MNKKILGIAAFALSFAMGQSAFALDDMSMCRDRMQNMITTLKLDDSQQAKIKAIKEQLKSSQSANWQQMKDLRSQINKLVQSDSMDESKLNTLVNQQAQLIGETIKAKSKAENQIYAVLNTQQKAQYPQMMEQQEEKIKNMFKKCDD